MVSVSDNWGDVILENLRLISEFRHDRRGESEKRRLALFRLNRVPEFDKVPADRPGDPVGD